MNVDFVLVAAFASALVGTGIITAVLANGIEIDVARVPRDGQPVLISLLHFICETRAYVLFVQLIGAILIAAGLFLAYVAIRSG